MPDILSLWSLYADICVTYATLSISFFVLSRSEPFTFKGSHWKRVIFGVIAGITALYLRGNQLVLTDNLSFSFEMLPMILVTFFGGWLSGLCSFLTAFFFSGMLTLNNLFIAIILGTLFLFRVWRRRKHRELYITIVLVGIFRLLLVSGLHGIKVPWTELIFYQVIAAFCMILCYHALNYKEIYMNKVFTIRVKAATDELTQINNRASIDYWLAQRQIQREACGLILLDIDNFKRVNDTLGHLVGDRVLIEVGRLLRHLTRNDDFAGRYGGEEFLIMTSAYDPDTLLSIAERIRQEVENCVIMLEDGRELKVTVSLGVSLYLPGMIIRKSLKLADLSLYEAKRQGKNRVVGSSILTLAALGHKRHYSKL
ncbi:GGDEF domain-containing protein [Rahnella victoriana]|uniref:diguanylate cyclase n=1 Tax=Rahnella victoriana TaxID=1510570 RepID=A0ABS0DP60_9GAMM|nr:GGDEF domain-containing protein [Rahnella victoriana]MBF7955676.1 GGDEF domain-containing protein [Rahnella victoriana]UHM90282.1 GGDEF domain-containing protein [Rahnella victoriana]